MQRILFNTIKFFNTGFCELPYNFKAMNYVVNDFLYLCYLKRVFCTWGLFITTFHSLTNIWGELLC